MHILPDLKILENKFSVEDGLVVVSSSFFLQCLELMIFEEKVSVS